MASGLVALAVLSTGGVVPNAVPPAWLGVRAEDMGALAVLAPPFLKENEASTLPHNSSSPKAAAIVLSQRITCTER